MAFEAHTRVVVSGPVFDGLAERELDRFEADLVDEVGVQGVAEVAKLGRAHFRYEHSLPTGHYLRNIRPDRRVDDVVVHVDAVIYGPWIEGTSSMNDRTRFKGYQLFRKATQQLESRVETIAKDLLPPYLRRMN